jgi:hypothetical protein
MKTGVAIVLMFCCARAPAADVQKTEITGVSIIMVTPYGFGMRFVIPFLAKFNSDGRRIWECITDPFYAKGEDSRMRDVNLFSICGIRITAGTPEQNPEHLTIDFSRMKIPGYIKIPKEEIVSNLLTCILYCTRDVSSGDARVKPLVRLVGRPEDKVLLATATEQYQIASSDNVEFDFTKSSMLTNGPVKHPTLAEELDQDPSNIASDKVLADGTNGDGRIVVRDVQIKTDNEHYYRFEFYRFGILQNCDTWRDNGDPGKATVTWSSASECIIMLDDWLQVTFERDQPPHWSIGRRAD